MRLLPSLLLAITLLPAAVAAQRSTALPEPPVSQKEIDRALGLGRDWLLKNAAYSRHDGERSLMYFAAMHAGLDKQTPVLHELAKELSRAEFVATYDTACVICFLVTLDPEAYFETICRATTQLVDMQNPNGSWGYPRGEDLSNTQFGALGLWYASTIGISIDAKVWKRLAKRVREYQIERRGFAYKNISVQSGYQANQRMTAAGVGTLAICEAELLRLSEITSAERKDLALARQRGLEFLEDGFPASSSKPTDWNGYCWYGFDRVGAWTGLSRMGAHDWYQRGANQLIPTQAPEGCWSWESSVTDVCPVWRDDDIWGSTTATSFAILFLARATHEESDRIAVTDGSGHDAGSAAAEVSMEFPFARLRAEGSGPGFKLGTEKWDWSTLRPYEWPGEEGRGPRVSYVEYLVNREVVRVQLVDSTRPILDKPLLATVWTRQVGPNQLSMRLHLELPPKNFKGAEGNPLADVLELGPIEVHAIRTMPRVDDPSRPDLGDMRVALASATSGASSRATVGAGAEKLSHVAALAVDGKLSTAWLARANDQRRTWTMRIGRPLSTAVLIVHPAMDGGKLGPLAQVKLIEVLVNDEDRHVLVMPGNGVAGRLRFDSEIEIERLELRVISLQQAEAGKSSPFGFAEVELQRAGG